MEETNNHFTTAVGAAIVLGGLMIIVLPNFIGSQCGSHGTARVRGVMRTVQIAAEAYYAKTGKYPATMAEMSPFFPRGSEVVGGKPGIAPLNPVTGRVGVFVGNQIRSVEQILRKRASNPAKVHHEGEVIYSVLDDCKRGYAIVGCGENGFEVTGVNGHVLVMTNDFESLGTSLPPSKTSPASETLSPARGTPPPARGTSPVRGTPSPVSETPSPARGTPSFVSETPSPARQSSVRGPSSYVGRTSPPVRGTSTPVEINVDRVRQRILVLSCM